jgi:hypothetical protein
MLLASGLTGALPELLDQLAKANFAAKTALAQRQGEHEASTGSIGGGKKRKASSVHTDERHIKIPRASEAAHSKSTPSGPVELAVPSSQKPMLRLKRPSPTKAAAALPSPGPARPPTKIVIVGPHVRSASALPTPPVSPAPSAAPARPATKVVVVGPYARSAPASLASPTPLPSPAPRPRKIEVVGKFAYAAAPGVRPAFLAAAEPASAPTPRRIKVVGRYARPCH